MSDAGRRVTQKTIKTIFMVFRFELLSRNLGRFDKENCQDRDQNVTGTVERKFNLKCLKN